MSLGICSIWTGVRGIGRGDHGGGHSPQMGHRDEEEATQHSLAFPASLGLAAWLFQTPLPRHAASHPSPSLAAEENCKVSNTLEGEKRQVRVGMHITCKTDANTLANTWA